MLTGKSGTLAKKKAHKPKPFHTGADVREFLGRQYSKIQDLSVKSGIDTMDEDCNVQNDPDYDDRDEDDMRRFITTDLDGLRKTRDAATKIAELLDEAITVLDGNQQILINEVLEGMVECPQCSHHFRADDHPV